MRVRSVHSAGVLFVLLTSALPAVAGCKNPKQAADAYDEGDSAMRDGKADAAVRKYKDANRLCPDARTHLAIALAHLLGRQQRLATEALNRYIAEGKASVDWCAVLDTRRQIVASNRGEQYTLTVNLSPRSARAYIRESSAIGTDPLAPGCQLQPDGEHLATRLAPGSYTVVGLLEQREPIEMLAEVSQSGTIEITFPNYSEPSPSAPLPTTSPAVEPVRRIALTGPERTRPFVVRAPRPPWYERPENWIWIGSGLVGVASVATGIWTHSLESDLDRACHDRHCPPSSWTEVDKHDRLAAISTVGFIVAGVGAAAGTGVYFALRSPFESKQAGTVGAAIAPGNVTLNWRF